MFAVVPLWALTAWLGFNLLAVCVLLLCSLSRAAPPVTEQECERLGTA